MLIQDRRRCRPHAAAEMLARLNINQRFGVANLEREGWKLRFVRHGAAGAPVAVLVGRGNEHVSLDTAGRIDPSPTLSLRN